MDFDYFTSIVRSEDESHLDRFNSGSKQFVRKIDNEKEKSPDDFITDEVRAVLESEVSVLEFCQLTMKPLYTLCDGDREECKENSNAKIAVQILGFALENLCCLQYGSEVALSAHLSANDLDNLKLDMSWLLHSSLSKVFRFPETTCTIIEHKTLATILMLLEDSLKKLKSQEITKELEKSNKYPNSDETHLNPDYVYSILNCVFLFFHSILGMHKPDDFYLSLFLEMFCMFEKCCNGSLIELAVTSASHKSDAIENEPQEMHLSTGFQILDLLGSLISKVKEVRMEVALKDGSLSEIMVSHSNRKHARGGRSHSLGRRSDLTHLIHHHKTDVFGIPGLTFNSEKETPPCTVSILFDKLVDLIINGRVNLNLRFHAAQVAMKCGTCCCFPSLRLLDAVSNALLSDISESAKRKNFQTSCFLLLERSLYPQLWGCVSQLTPLSALENHSCCAGSAGRNCKLNNGNFPQRSMKDESICPNSQSLGSAMNANENLSTSEFLSHWNKLSFYKELIDSKDFKLSHQTFSHLIRIFAMVTPEVLYELLSLVIFPAFVSAKKKYLFSGCEIAKFKIFSCLSIFSCYLGKSPEFVLEFFDPGSGLLHILDLVFLQEFTQTCCYVLEEIVLVVVNELPEDTNTGSTSTDSVKSVNSNLLLLTAIDNFSERLVINLRQIFDTGNCSTYFANLFSHQYEEYSSMERYFNGETSDDSFKDTSMKYFCSNFLSKIEMLELDSFVKVLKFSYMFWKACATLILKSKLYQDIFSSTIVSKKGFLLLQMLVLNVTSCSHSAGDVSSNLCIKTIEALLTIYLKFSANDTFGNQTGEASVLEKVRSMLLGLPAYPSVEICLLCEVFIRCSTDDCSGRSALMLSRKPELPTLKVNLDGNNCGELEAVLDDIDDEDDGGSITRGDACVTADEGYDGDVEILEVDEVPSNWNIHNRSDSCVASLPNSLTIADPTPARKWTMQNIIFPDLCCLALDLLGYVHNSADKHLDSPSKLNLSDQKESISGDTVTEVEDNYMDIIVQALQRLDALCRENCSNCYQKEELSKNSSRVSPFVLRRRVLNSLGCSKWCLIYSLI